MRIGIVRDEAGMDAIMEGWDRLAVQADRPMASPHWLRPWLRHLGPDEPTVRVITCATAGRLVGVVPLLAVRRQGTWRYSTFGASGMVVGGAPLAESGHSERVASATAWALRRLRPRVGELRLVDVEEANPLNRHLARYWRCGRFVAHSEPAPVIRLDSDGFDGWLAGRSSRFRKSARQRRRRLEKAGVEIVRAGGGEELKHALASYHVLHRQMWGDNSPLTTPSAERAIREAANSLADRGRFAAWIARGADGEVGAVEMFLRAGETMLTWTGGRDRDWDSLSPSQALILEVIGDAHRTGASTIDLGNGRHDWKGRLTEVERALLDVRMLPATLPGAASSALYLWGRLRRRLLRELHER